MSRTSEIRKCILDYLSDGNVHEASEIKKYLRETYTQELGDGIIAGALRTMTVAGTIDNVERGKYVNAKQNNSVQDSNFEYNIKSVEKQIIELTEKYECEAIKIINSIDITEQNIEDIKKGIQLRKKIEKLCDDIKSM